MTSKNTIAIYAEDLRVATTSTPCREMLRALVQLRSSDHFVFLVRNGSEREDWLHKYLDSLPKNISLAVVPMRWGRKVAGVRGLLGLPQTEAKLVKANIYIRFDVGRLGISGEPLIDLVTDLSSFERGRASMPWHGRVLFRRALRRTLRHSSDTVAISEATAKAVREHDPAMKTRLHVIPNGIARQWHELGAEDARELASEWIWYGQITPRKNLDGMLAAYRELHRIIGRRIPKLSIIAKDSPYRRAWCEKVARFGLHEQVKISDPLCVEELIHKVKVSRGLVFPSFHEGFGMPIVEAMACGRPVLTSNTTSMPEVAGGLSVLCDPHDVASITAGLRALLAPSLDTSEARSARRAHAARYTALNAAKAYSRLIDEVLSRAEHFPQSL